MLKRILLTGAIVLCLITTLLVFQELSRIRRLNPVDPLLSDQSLTIYLENQSKHTSFGGRPFCQFQRIGTTQITRRGVNEYIWVYCQEFYVLPSQPTQLQRGTAYSLLAAVSAEKQGDKFVPTKYFETANGSLFAPANTGRFPRIILEEAARRQARGLLIADKASLESRAKAYFKIT